ncbi:hypothetical protein E2C01_022892 [Portunus trituberculatus]|uniref:Uncharacterized protein n=1 Tax=Portunus trituberculatus TaxID=210409 RepID=A0A5B7E7D0_PORTR|nr:hypothetical protein [Portunus trituberculatus]
MVRFPVLRAGFSHGGYGTFGKIVLRTDFTGHTESHVHVTRRALNPSSRHRSEIRGHTSSIGREGEGREGGREGGRRWGGRASGLLLPPPPPPHQHHTTTTTTTTVSPRPRRHHAVS